VVVVVVVVVDIHSHVPFNSNKRKYSLQWSNPLHLQPAAVSISSIQQSAAANSLVLLLFSQKREREREREKGGSFHLIIELHSDQVSSIYSPSVTNRKTKHTRSYSKSRRSCPESRRKKKKKKKEK